MWLGADIGNNQQLIPKTVFSSAKVISLKNYTGIMKPVNNKGYSANGTHKPLHLPTINNTPLYKHTHDQTTPDL